jgi:D-arabinose 1-dehydrogenase-like Zn-dependent alcohol dehydrogenase
MKMAQIPGTGAEFKIAECEIHAPGAGQVRIKVQACGVCHSDALTKEGAWPGIQYPRDFPQEAPVAFAKAVVDAGGH